MKNIALALWISSILIGLSLSNCQNKKKETPLSTTSEDSLSSESKEAVPRILFFGNSLTAGYGLDPSEAFPALIQEKLDSLNYSYQVVNAGLSGETTAAGLKRIDWVLKQEIELFVLELGGNDGLRGIDPQSTQKNLIQIIEKVRKKYPKVKILLTGMETPPNMGQDYVQAFRKVFPSVAEETEVAFMPFLLKDVGGIPELNQADGIHPTVEGQKIVANNVWEELKPLLKAEN